MNERIDEQQVIRRVVAGDVESFRILVERYQRAVFCMVRNLLRGSHSCEDIAQEVFLAAFLHLGSYDPSRARFSTWLLTITRNKCLNALKRKQPVTRDRLPELEAEGPAERQAAEELFRRLDEALAGLPFEQRVAFVMADIQGASLQEIAAVEGVKLGTVKSRLSRARQKLRAVLHEEEP